MYNINQTQCMISAIRKRYKRQLTSASNALYETDSSIISNITRIMDYINELADTDIIFPTDFYLGNKKDILLRNILLHIQDIMRLNFHKRYASICYYLANCK